MNLAFTFRIILHYDLSAYYIAHMFYICLYIALYKDVICLMNYDDDDKLPSKEYPGPGHLQELSK